MWRKNRQSPPSGSTCYGTDINRNWNVHWSDTGGASTDPCADDYKGLAAFDAPETKTLAAFTSSKVNSTQGVKMYLDWHSYSQMFFTRKLSMRRRKGILSIGVIAYGFSCTLVPPDNTELTALAKGFTVSLEAVYGTQYEYGSSCNILYKTTGSSDDYASVVTYVFASPFEDCSTIDILLCYRGIKYSFAAELRDTGDYGFILPADQIYPSGVETWAGVRYLLAKMN